MTQRHSYNIIPYINRFPHCSHIYIYMVGEQYLDYLLMGGQAPMGEGHFKGVGGGDPPPPLDFMESSLDKH